MKQSLVRIRSKQAVAARNASRRMVSSLVAAATDDACRSRTNTLVAKTRSAKQATFLDRHRVTA